MLIRLEGAVRRCGEADLPALEWDAELRDHRAVIREAYERQERGENLMLVADLGGRIVGQAWVDLARYGEERVGYLWAVRVAAPLHGLGIGSVLLAAAERSLAERGWAGAEIGVEKHNEAARRLYERLGYRRVGEVRETWGYRTPDGRDVEHELDEWVLRKEIFRGSPSSQSVALST